MNGGSDAWMPEIGLDLDVNTVAQLQQKTRALAASIAALDRQIQAAPEARFPRLDRRWRKSWSDFVGRFELYRNSIYGTLLQVDYGATLEQFTATFLTARAEFAERTGQRLDSPALIDLEPNIPPRWGDAVYWIGAAALAVLALQTVIGSRRRY